MGKRFTAAKCTQASPITTVFPIWDLAVINPGKDIQETFPLSCGHEDLESAYQICAFDCGIQCWRTERSRSESICTTTRIGLFPLGKLALTDLDCSVQNPAAPP
ncbi:uncharacterized protein AAG666_006323 isoform 1-T1 [Megaptera novaeangliae]